MKIEIETDDFDILEGFEDYDDPDIKDKNHRRWGRISWLYPGEFVAQISGDSAKAIIESMKEEIKKQQEMRQKHEDQKTERTTD